MDALPSFYDDLDGFRAEGWRRLADGVGHRHSPFHTPSLATVDAAGRPRLRTVVLRAAEAGAGALRFHCDRRSDKAQEIAENGLAALHVYDGRAKLQLRVEGRARLHHDDALADAAWAAALTMSRVCYGVEPAPGTALAAGDAYAMPDEDPDARIGRENFCAVVFTAERLDLLYLDRRGHRRAAFSREGEGWMGTWVAP
ncbi:MAG: pyridoxamine 5'-phosphate oxidase family protein [Methylobacteriaceae bacterium]|uniref:Pyridoxamine 5'-phosphate oxidase family protein n=1 Tax=Methylorubrum extorquens TaxID=408 RepID=A0AAX3WES3_METEX|nr:pyridoxamine 5'-phosphate oxidase family protein [Methylorubrum extorquens]KQO78630.1 pyridoxamine 5'-phosphate oxidase [Methylobacterium sp. Leaf90]KQO90648.1 pyridoxamine 5'-phosphate oxidase [Methylobacterium sp. Leaf92]WHQ69336.1 pyridoxamine 5'-phosphate oxidase family protein [Methylorubrum extorquens]